jgi:hypothetical protein
MLARCRCAKLPQLFPANLLLSNAPKLGTDTCKFPTHFRFWLKIRRKLTVAVDFLIKQFLREVGKAVIGQSKHKERC